MCKLKKYNGTSNTRIDKCIRKFIKILKHNLRDIKIVACCCGYGKYPMTIIVERRIVLLEKVMYYDMVSGKEIPRTRNFYKKDKQGYYYIPELRPRK